MSNRLFAASVLACAAGLALAGCAEVGNPRLSWEQAKTNPLIQANYAAADGLLVQIASRLNKGQPLIIATVVSIDDLDRSSTLGRLTSEHVSARFTQAGYKMIELKYRNGIYIKRTQGELMLTREIHELAKSHAAQAVIVGTYGQSDNHMFINLKVIQPDNNIVLAVLDYTVPLDINTRALLIR